MEDKTMLGINTMLAKAVMTKAIKKILIKQGFDVTEFIMREFEMHNGDDGQTIIEVNGTFILENDELWQWILKRL
jgi:hypothetical protein